MPNKYESSGLAVTQISLLLFLRMHNEIFGLSMDGAAATQYEAGTKSKPPALETSLLFVLMDVSVTNVKMTS